VSEKVSRDNWSIPQNIGNIINSDFNENYPSVDAFQNLYFFTNRNQGIGGCDIYVSNYLNGEYQKPLVLNEAINSKKNDWDSFIASDGSYIIFSSQNRDDTIGEQDLYISFKDKNGEWTRSVNMGPGINSTRDEICPGISPYGKHLFFTSRRRGNADIFWIDAKIIEELRSIN